MQLVADSVRNPARLEALRRTGLLDSEPEEAFDRFTRLAARLARAPIASVALVDEYRQFFKSAIGFPEPIQRARGTPLTHSICQHVVTLREPLVIPDTSLHSMVSDNPCVQLGVAAYLGVPLILPGGEAIGTLCVIDVRPREWTAADLASLQELAAMTMTEVAVRREAANAQEAHTKLGLSMDMISTVGFDGYFREVSGAFKSMLGYSVEELIGRPYIDFVHPDDREATERAAASIAAGVDLPWFENRYIHKDGSQRWLQWAVKSMPQDQMMYAVARDVTAQHHWIEELRVSEERFALAVRGSSAGLWDWNLVTNECYYAPRFLDLLGLTEDDCPLAGAFFSERVHPGEMDYVTEALKSHLEGRGPYEIECQLRPGNGAYRWFQVRGQALWDEHGQPYRIVGSIADIHERRLAQEQVRSLASRLTTTLDSLTDAFITVDRDFTCTYINQLAERMLSRTRASVLGKNLFKEFPDLCEGIIGREAQRALEENCALHCEAFHAPLNGWLEVHVYPSPLGLALYFRNITHRKKAEEELRWKTAFLEAQVNSSPDGVVVVDTQGRKILQNQRFAELCKIPPHIAGDIDDRVQLRWVAGMTKNPRQYLEQAIYQQAHPEEISRDEIEFKDGTVLDRYSAPVVGEDGQVYGRIRLLRDITESRNAQLRVSDLNSQLFELSREAGMAEIATSVLHNVGNVLNSANVSLEVATAKVHDLNGASLERVADLLHEHADDLPTFLGEHPQGKHLGEYLSQLSRHFAAEQSAALAEIKALRNHIDHINEIVARQQSFATVRGFIEVVPILGVIEDALAMNALPRNGSNFELVREIDGAIPPLPLDRHKVMQILVNLIRNARYALQESNGPDRKLRIRAELAEGRRLRITVADNGVGISAANLKHIFEYGFTTRKSGHGFGLHSCAVAAQEMDGTLSVASEGVGLGAVFTLEIPCENDDS
jgi:PAS domain S-box-containing protein